MPDFYRTKDIKEKLGCSRYTICRWMKDGKLPTPTKVIGSVAFWEKTAFDDWMSNKGENSEQ